MKKETEALNLPKDFFKQFKHKEQFQNFFQSLFKQGIEAMLQAELDEHLGYEKHSPAGYNTGNSRNGSSAKTVKTESVGDLALSIPRDRNGSFEPGVIPRHSRMTDKLEDAIIGMYSRGMTTPDIEQQVAEIYGVSVSPTTVSNITNKLLDNIKAWQSRPLEKVYFVVWLDGIRLKIRHNSRIVDKTIYLVIGLNSQGLKEVLGMWVSETESASFWLSVLNDLKNRGVQDILIACTDNLAGFTQAIKAAFTLALTQLCIVHQIRNSCKFVPWSERRAFAADLKDIYTAVNEQAAADALDRFEAKWGAKYAYAIKSWRSNWAELVTFLDFPPEIRHIIYTTNIIESLNSGVRKFTKTKTIFPHDDAAFKVVYMAVANIERKWTMPIKNWGLILQQFLIIFGERCRL